MGNPSRVAAEAGGGPSVESLTETGTNGFTDEVKTVLERLSELHEQTLALVEVLSEINERTYQLTLEFLRDMQTRTRGLPLKK